MKRFNVNIWGVELTILQDYDGKFIKPDFVRDLEQKGTSLKPACEPIVLARKPLSEKNVARNVLKWGTGGLNIDGCRIQYDTTKEDTRRTKSGWQNKYVGGDSYKNYGIELQKNRLLGRYPANVILDEEAAKMLDEQSGDLGVSRGGYRGKGGFWGNLDEDKNFKPGYGDSGGASRFFYCAKAGRNERFAYCKTCDKVIPQKEWDKHKGHELIFHTTVKPLKLMEYLVRLVTPPNGVVLDPFLGTGTTAVAALKQGFKFVGIEINEYYYKIAEFRVNQIKNRPTLYNVFK